MRDVATTLRVGKIAYTNCLPFYYGLAEADVASFSLVEDVPAKINEGMRNGEIDIAPISSLEYLNQQDQYLVLPGIGVGARDFSRSVILFSQDKIESLQDQKIALTNESLSSAALLKILLKFKFNYNNEFVTVRSNVEEMLEQHKAALVIGDDALFHTSEKFVYKFDLSELWWNWTEKPFCFALWAVRREFANENPELVVSFYDELRKNLTKNLVDLEKLIKHALDMDFLDERFSKVFGYLFNLSYGMDDSMKEGLELFYQLAAKLGISPKAKAIEYFES